MSIRSKFNYLYFKWNVENVIPYNSKFFLVKNSQVGICFTEVVYGTLLTTTKVSYYLKAKAK